MMETTALEKPWIEIKRTVNKTENFIFLNTTVILE